MISRQDKFGFYEVGPKLKFYSKLEAVEVSKKLNLPMRWVFNDSVYDSYDWTVEPTTTLAELYKRRAQQLREQYDHLILWYSGGADSANILRSFVDNDIKLDEVLSFINYSVTRDKEHITNAEVFYVADPTIRKVQEKQPDLKYRVEDIANVMADTYSDRTGIDWIYDLNGFITPHSLGKQELKLSIPEWKNMYEQGKKVCHIFGIDKPIVRHIGDKFMFHFWDRVDNAVTARSQRLDRPWEYNELFYWTPDLPEIVIKQAHVIKRYLKTIRPEDFDQEIVNKEHKEWGPHALTREWERGARHVSIGDRAKESYITYDKIHELIYPGWYPVPYQIKTRGIVFSDKDDWFWTATGNEQARTNHLTGLKELWLQMPDEFKRNTSDMSTGFKPTNSKAYNLGT